MGIYSDFRIDKDRCKRCGRLLYKYVTSKKTRRVLTEWDNDLIIATLIDICCGYCGGLTEIFYQADMLPIQCESATEKRRFAWAPAA